MAIADTNIGDQHSLGVSPSALKLRPLKKLVGGSPTMSNSPPVATYRTFGMRLGLAILELVPLIILGIRLALHGKGPWLFPVAAIVIEGAFILAASKERITFYQDRVERWNVFGGGAIPYASITQISGRLGLRVLAGQRSIYLQPETFLKANAWIEAVEILAQKAPHAVFDEAALRKRHGRIGLLRAGIFLFWVGALVSFLLVSHVAISE